MTVYPPNPGAARENPQSAPLAADKEAAKLAPAKVGRVYFLSTSEDGLRNRLFAEPSKPYEGGLSEMPIWYWLKNAAEKKGIYIATHDEWSREGRRENDILIVQNHPGESLPWRIFYRLKFWKAKGGFFLARRRFFYRNYKFFGRRILIQIESPMIMPYTYRKLGDIKRSGMYHKIYLLSGRKDGFNYYNFREESIKSPHFDKPKDKFLAMVNANMTLHSVKNELYGERLKAIRYFSGVPGFDLYGYNWDKFLWHPFYFYYRKYVQRAWRGPAPNKMETVSRYKFSLCFENCIYPEYVSEKIYDCMAAGSIPIYLGAPDIDSIVPPSCFINFRKFSSKRGPTFSEKDYSELHKYLTSLSPADLERYRSSISMFLQDGSDIIKLGSFLEEISR
jgi:hypothetical protein